MSDHQALSGLQAFALRIRRTTVEMISRAGASHIGSALSCVDVLAALYGSVLRVRPREPAWPERDRFVLSKGHAVASLYATLALRGFFPVRRLREFYVDGGTLAGHATHRGVPGVEASTGSLGHGLGLAVGFALGANRLGRHWHTYVLLSDGECDEGSTWEAAMLAGARGLGNVTAIVDYNKLQSLGRVEEVMPLEPFAQKWRSFRWQVREIDGHCVDQLLNTLDPTKWRPRGRPRLVIAHTVKGKGVSFMEDKLLWHYRAPRGEEVVRALDELQQ